MFYKVCLGFDFSLILNGFWNHLVSQNCFQSPCWRSPLGARAPFSVFLLKVNFGIDVEQILNHFGTVSAPFRDHFGCSQKQIQYEKDISLQCHSQKCGNHHLNDSSKWPHRTTFIKAKIMFSSRVSE